MRAIYELGVSQVQLAMPEVLWKSYIDFESVEGAYERDRARVRALYERLVERTGHVKVWISWALFEGGELKPPADEDEDGETQEVEGIPGDLDMAREIFERGYKDLRNKGLKDEVRLILHPTFPAILIVSLQRVVLLEAWKAFEKSNGTEADVAEVQARMPQVTKRWRKLDNGDMEECTFFAPDVPRTGRVLMHRSSDWDILFADDEREANPATFKFIQNALAWRMKEGGGMDLSAALLAQDDEEEEEEEEEDVERSSNEGDRNGQRRPVDSDDERSSNGIQED